MKTLAILLILTGLSLQEAYAASEEGATELSSVSTAHSAGGVERKAWTEDSFTDGNPRDVIELVDGLTREEGRRSSTAGSGNRVKSALDRSAK